MKNEPVPQGSPRPADISHVMRMFRQIAVAVVLLAAFGRPASGQTSSPYPEVRLLVDADKSFVETAGGTEKATAAIRDLIARVDAIYRSQLGLTVTLVGPHLWSDSDPFDRSGQSALLASFADYAESNYRGSYSYDAGHLLVGSALGGEGGIAYEASACGDSFSAPAAYGLSQPDLTDVYEFNAHLVSHELGHNMGAEHDEYPGCAKKNVMCPGQIGGDFSAAAKSSIAAYVLSRSSAGCFAAVSKIDPLSSVRLTASISGSSIKYRVTGASRCTSLSIVSSPSSTGLATMFAYLPLGTLRPAETITAISRNLPRLRRRPSKIYFGVYCDGQLAATKPALDAGKLRSRSWTSSLVTELQRLKKGFR